MSKGLSDGDSTKTISICRSLFEKIVKKEGHVTSVCTLLLESGVTCDLRLKFQVFAKQQPRGKRKAALWRLYLRCAQQSCEAKWIGHLSACPSSNAPVEMTFSMVGSQNHQPEYQPKVMPSLEAKDMVAAALKSGKGPTEAFEDATFRFREKAPSLSTIRKARNPGCNRISTQMQLLNVLRRTYIATVNPDSPLPGYIQDLNAVPVRAILHSADQVRLAKEAAILHIDATAGVIRKSLYTNATTYIFTIVPESAKSAPKAVSVSDFVSERCRVEDIIFWLSSFRCAVNRLAGDRIDALHHRVIVMDMSWAIIHASILIFCGCFVGQYLDNIFQQLTKKNVTGPIIFLCSSHVISKLSKSLTIITQVSEKRLFLACFGRLLMADSLAEAGDIWRRMIIIFASKAATTDSEDALSELCDPSHVQLQDPEDSISLPFEDFLDDGTLRRQSPFWRYFHEIFSNFVEATEGPPNPHYHPQAVEFVLQQWLPLYGIWGSPVLQGTGYRYLTNAKIESWFSWMKRFQLGNISSRRVGLQAFIERQFERTRARLKAIEVESCKRTKKSSFSGSREVWKRKKASDRTPKYLINKVPRCIPTQSNLKEESHIDLTSVPEDKISDSSLDLIPTSTQSQNDVDCTVCLMLGTHKVCRFMRDSLLTENAWLEGSLLCAYLTYLASGSVTFAPYETDMVFGVTPIKQNLQEKMKGRPLVFCGLILSGNHYSVFFANARTQQFHYMDPLLHREAKFRKKYFDLWIKFASGFGYDRWENASTKHAEQKDSYNCGVFCALFGEWYFGARRSLNFPSDLESMKRHRWTIWREIVNGSKTSRSLCRACGERDSPFNAGRLLDDWIQCDGCLSWFHTCCVGKKEEVGIYNCCLCLPVASSPFTQERDAYAGRR